MLTQFPQGTHMDVDEMLRRLQEDGSQQTPWMGSTLTTVEQKPVMVRGQQCTLSIGEGQTSEGETFRAATVAFQGKSGPALLAVSGPLEEWDQEMVDTLIASMR